MFDKVEAYFVNKRGVDDAVDLARKSKDLTQQIAHAVDQHDFDSL
jgi:hypothetical protein